MDRALGERRGMGIGEADDAVAGAAQGRVHAEKHLMYGCVWLDLRSSTAATAQPSLELLELLRRKAHVRSVP